MTDTLTAAWWLADRGMRVFDVDHPDLPICAGVRTREHDPATCTERGKHPCSAWSKTATVDRQEITAMFAGALRNIGVACGPSGLLVVDEDILDDFAQFAETIEQTIPTTFRVKTGKGWHYYFRQPPGAQLGNHEGALRGYGVNIRGAGGYVVAPGSMHATGVMYLPENPDAPIAPCPDWLVQALTDKPANGTTAAAEFFVGAKDPAWWRDAETIHHPNRHNALVAAAGYYLKLGLRREQAVPAIRDVWRRCCPGTCPEHEPAQPYTWDRALARLEDVFTRYEPGELRGEDPDAPNAGPPGLGKVYRRSELSDLPTVHPLVDRVMSQPAAVVLVGAYGLGKSAIAHALACCVATGRPWLGRATERRRVLLVVGEGAHGLDARLAAWELAWNQAVPVPDEDLVVIVKPGSLRDWATWTTLQRYAIEGGYGMVILDTFSSLAADADEVKDAARIMRQLSDLSTAIDGTAVLVHHPGWSDATRVRGGYQFEANADEVLVVTGVSDDSPVLCLTRKKVKDGESGATLWLRRTASHGSIIIESAMPNDAELPVRDRILAILDNYGELGATGPQMQAEAGVDDGSRSGFYRALRALKADGRVIERGTGNSRRYYRPEQVEGAP